MIKQPKKPAAVAGVGRGGHGMQASSNLRAAPKALTPGPLKLPSKKSANMGFDPSVPLVNSSKPGWSKPPTSPQPTSMDGRGHLHDANNTPATSATLPSSSVWGRKSTHSPDASPPPPMAAAPGAPGKGIGQQTDFPPPGSNAGATSSGGRPAGNRTSGGSRIPAMDWSTEDASVEMDFNQPLFVGQHAVELSPTAKSRDAAQSFHAGRQQPSADSRPVQPVAAASGVTPGSAWNTPLQSRVAGGAAAPSSAAYPETKAAEVQPSSGDLGEEQTGGRNSKFKSQREYMVHQAQLAAEKRRHDEESEERERKQRLQKRLTELEQQRTGPKPGQAAASGHMPTSPSALPKPAPGAASPNASGRREKPTLWEPPQEATSKHGRGHAGKSSAQQGARDPDYDRNLFERQHHIGRYADPESEDRGFVSSTPNYQPLPSTSSPKTEAWERRQGFGQSQLSSQAGPSSRGAKKGSDARRFYIGEKPADYWELSSSSDTDETPPMRRGSHRRKYLPAHLRVPILLRMPGDAMLAATSLAVAAATGGSRGPSGGSSGGNSGSGLGIFNDTFLAVGMSDTTTAKAAAAMDSPNFAELLRYSPPYAFDLR